MNQFFWGVYRINWHKRATVRKGTFIVVARDVSEAVRVAEKALEYTADDSWHTCITELETLFEGEVLVSDSFASSVKERDR